MKEPTPLKLCPFCGGPAMNIAAEYITCGAAWNRECLGHQIKAQVEANNYKTSNEWNTRAPDERDVLIETLAEALRKISKINTASCEKYVSKADSIAIDALIAFDDWKERQP